MLYPWRSLLSWFVVLSLSRPAVLAEPPQAPALTPAQQQRLDETKRLAKQAEDLQKSGKLAEAVAAVEKVVAIQRAVFGDQHEQVADTLVRLAALHEEREDFAAARKARQEVLAVWTQLHGEKHWKVIDARFALAATQLPPEQQHQLVEARLLRRQVLRLQGQGKFADALPLARKVVEVRRAVLGEHHPDYADSLNHVGMLYQAMGEYAQAKPLFRQAMTILRQALGERHPNYAASLHNLALLYQDMGDYAQAEPLFRQAVTVCRQALGEHHHFYGASLNGLGMLYQARGDYAQAEPLLQQALTVFRQTRDEHHPDYAVGLNNLGMLYAAMGDYARAEPILQQALKTRRQAVGERHPAYANSLTNLATLYEDMGDYAQAEALFQQAVTVRRQALGERHHHYAQSLHNLARLYQTRGDYARAEPLFQQALAIYRQAVGEHHPAYATCLSTLGMLYLAKKDYVRAEPLLQQAMTVCRQALGEQHPDYGHNLNNLGMLYLNKGDYTQAESLFQRAVKVRRQALGEHHPLYATSLNNLAAPYLWRGDAAQAEPLIRQALAIDEQLWGESFAVLSERQRIRLLDSLRAQLDAYLSLAAKAQTPAADLHRHVLAWKGAVATRQAEDRLARDHPELKDLIGQLAQARRRLAHLAFAAPGPRQRDAWLRQLDDLRGERENLEGELARRSQAFRTEQQRRQLTSADVARALPAATAFVDLVEYTHLSPPKGGKGPTQRERRLLAFVLSHDQPPACVFLQAAAPVHEAVRSWRQALTKGDAQALTSAAAVLGERLWKPLQPHLGGAQTVLVAPDGVLAQFPLAALPGRRPGSYLLEDMAIGYVTSGRQVVDLFSPTPVKTDAHGLLALGGIDYTADPAAPTPAASVRAPQVAARERSGFGFLPGTEREARHCRELFRQTFPQERALLLTGAAAGEARFKQECGQHWRYLHLATHGFFESPTRVAALLRGASGGAPLAPEAKVEEGKAFALAPLLRSGVVLAGAAHPRTAPPASLPGEESTGEDGILTAEEVAALDLRGCELVVLSACETGLGALERGEGVLGLQRAFQAAGARTLVASLWRIDDAATAVLMDEFYANLWQKKLSKLEALRQAQLTVLRQPKRVQERAQALRIELAKRGLNLKSQPLPDDGQVAGRSPPAWWAGFVLSGAGR